MGAVVSFNYATWAAMYPELSTVSSAAAQGYFAQATLYQANDGSGPVGDPNAQLALLNMLTAHIAALNATINGQQPNALVGRISSATEGSVTVSTELPVSAGMEAWCAQTKYGIAWWNATRQYRTFRYAPGPRFRRTI
jgi:hypothetical protein